MTHQPKVLEKQDMDSFLENIKSSLQHMSESGWVYEETEYLRCLVVLAHALNIDKDSNQLYSSLPATKMIGSLNELLNSLAFMGELSYTIPIQLNSIDSRLLPCLYLPHQNQKETNHPLVVLSKQQDTLYIYDSMENSIIEKSKNIDMGGNIWFFKNEEDVKKTTSQDNKNKNETEWFRNILGRFKILFIQIFSLSVAINILTLSVSIFVMFTYDRVVSSGSIENLLPFTIGISIAIFMELMLRSIRGNILSWLAARLDYIIGTSIFNHLMHMPAIFTEKASISSQINRIRAFDSVRDFFTSSLFLSIIEIPFTIILLVAIFIISGSIVIVPLTMAVLYAALVLFFQRSVKMKMSLAGKAADTRQKMLIDTFDKVEGYYASGLTDTWLQQFKEASGNSSIKDFESSYTTSIISVISGFIYTLSGMAVLILGIEKIWAGEITQGSLIAVMILNWKAISPLQSFCSSFPKYEQIKKSITQINRLMNIETENDTIEDNVSFKDIKGQISFSKVGLRYTQNTDPVFAGLSFDVEPGELVAIIGNNGTGKTTLLNLVNGLYKPQAGSVMIDGIDIRQINPLDIRKNIAYAAQNPDIFTGTIAENLYIMNPSATPDRISETLREIGGDEYIEKLPYGINTIIGKSELHEEAVKIPEIFHYHLNVARACIKDSKIMLFDELPYSFLNSSAGDKFKLLLKKWKGNKTVFIVTHRDDYIALADQVILLRKGKPFFIGKPSQLADVL